MKSVIPFTKELDFKGKIREITSISLEREFTVNTTSIDGFLYVTGDYKSHEVSANVIPFSFKIPFTIEIPENIEKESITLEISDFAYDLIEECKIKVNIELELEGKETKEEDKEEKEDDEIVLVNPDEIIKMMEEESIKEKESEREEEKEVEEEKIEEKEVEEKGKEQTVSFQENDELNEERIESEELILENVTKEDEYATYHIHIIKDGENIETICTMYNSNLNMLSEYNDLSNITTGEKLIIPDINE